MPNEREKKMRKKTFNSKFYNLEYYAYQSVSKVPYDTLIKCTLYGDITDDFLRKAKEQYGFLCFESEKSGFNHIEGTMTKKELERAKKDFKEYGVSIRYDKYVVQKYKQENGCLYSGWKTGIKTKIKPEDLPKSYVYINNYKKNGYLETAGVVDIMYTPSIFHNHTFKDDLLLISYTKQMDETISFDSCIAQADEYIFGNDIIQVIENIEKNNQNNESLQKKLSVIKKQMVEQYNKYVDEMNETFNRQLCEISSFDQLLS